MSDKKNVMIGHLCLDCLDYEVFQTKEKSYKIENFTRFDLRVPERYQNNRGGEYCKVGNIILKHDDDMTLIIDAEKFEDIEETFSEYFYHFEEIGWQTLSQCQ